MKYFIHKQTGSAYTSDEHGAVLCAPLYTNDVFDTEELYEVDETIMASEPTGDELFPTFQSLYAHVIHVTLYT